MSASVIYSNKKLVRFSNIEISKIVFENRTNFSLLYFMVASAGVGSKAVVLVLCLRGSSNKE